MKTAAERFFELAQSKVQETLEREMPHIQQAAAFVTESCKRGGRFYVFGAGHSHMIAEELYLRAGGLALVHGILPPELMIHQQPITKGTYLERLEGYAPALVELYRVEEKDTVMVVSNSGRNAMPVEMCLAAKAKGAKVIALTSMKHSRDCTSRHSCGKKIYEIADVTIDNCAEKGDAAFPIEGMDACVGPTSTITGVVIAEALACQVVENLVKEGITPPVFVSANVDGGDERNVKTYETYYGYWK